MNHAYFLISCNNSFAIDITILKVHTDRFKLTSGQFSTGKPLRDNEEAQTCLEVVEFFLCLEGGCACILLVLETVSELDEPR